MLLGTTGRGGVHAMIGELLAEWVGMCRCRVPRLFDRLEMSELLFQLFDLLVNPNADIAIVAACTFLFARRRSRMATIMLWTSANRPHLIQLPAGHHLDGAHLRQGLGDLRLLVMI